MFLKTSILTLAISIQFALAASVSILSPKANAHWHIGETVEIKWKLSDPSATGNLSLALASGPADALVINQVIASSVPVKAGQYNWTIPQKVKANKKYVIEVGQNAEDISFVGWVQILDPTGSGHSHKTVSSSARPTKTTTQPPIACVTLPGLGKNHDDQVRCHSFPEPEQTNAPKKPQAVKPKKHGTHKAKKNSKTTTKKTTTKKTTTKKTTTKTITHQAKQTDYVLPAGYIAI
ncbi:hypothetical protein J3Q64DRAFT_1693386 [Phycomyces blakesleeanus]|uniref:Yeast cell wall synthesis Kre9/Knh1-like N-terminal domain-containing protein n=2 Tax=Phycomyces blakesleeanus TaxID=4837 RepID=A0A162TIB8_PHYB8|nr:hypothetical protein PHYBLDRAFT_63616 [Phycomyces blakesleeanus NRRL 1555(-)]OAD67383.1 hypothetical protein PHYBLDRAFT_63616 [Phycomyces blakesleeanus NRRL 1555(-)]|eukprot:XP_018285423.1 hypothetical protein PHYBLDRAFT_63616 [Phycomyces blakesleeanus NRRL 1555(-)]